STTRPSLRRFIHLPISRPYRARNLHTPSGRLRSKPIVAERSNEPLKRKTRLSAAGMPLRWSLSTLTLDYLGKPGPRRPARILAERREVKTWKEGKIGSQRTAEWGVTSLRGRALRHSGIGAGTGT